MVARTMNRHLLTAAFLASGIHHHWGTGLSYGEAAKLRNNDEWK